MVSSCSRLEDLCFLLLTGLCLWSPFLANVVVSLSLFRSNLVSMFLCVELVIWFSRLYSCGDGCGDCWSSVSFSVKASGEGVRRVSVGKTSRCSGWASILE